MTDAMKPAPKRKSRGPFSEELIDQLPSQVRGEDAESLLGESGLGSGSAGRDRFADIIDFSYQNIAPGDALTTRVNLGRSRKGSAPVAERSFLFMTERVILPTVIP